jgi:hypothetical protein
MPTTRRRRRPTYIGLPREVVDMWLSGDRVALCSAFGIRPWQLSPLDDIPPEPPPEPDAATLAALPHAHSGWHRAMELRAALELYGPPGRSNRHGRPGA